MKSKQGKIIRHADGRYEYFNKSNWWGIEVWNPAEVIDGLFQISKRLFTANDGRIFQVRQDYTAIEVNQ